MIFTNQRIQIKFPQLFLFQFINQILLILPLLYKNLLELRKQIKFSNWFIMSIGLRMIEILEQLHNKNILHLDIKPENIMICQEFKNEQDILKYGFIQLIDFGLSQQYQENSESLQDIFIGSFNFASRSSHYGQPLGFKDDLESLLYVLLYLKDSISKQNTSLEITEEKLEDRESFYFKFDWKIYDTLSQDKKRFLFLKDSFIQLQSLIYLKKLLIFIIFFPNDPQSFYLNCYIFLNF
ncbi:unnamed protein product [Paramecium primaurelia]|uniref:Casein kinase I n=1 Tax=Paramecium primaurelia TaxID=5886 RepID=A0A8S1L7I6_PARPR|nr:unnamed protein product [Paramecium primaurelia]